MMPKTSVFAQLGKIQFSKILNFVFHIRNIASATFFEQGNTVTSSVERIWLSKNVGNCLSLVYTKILMLNRILYLLLCIALISACSSGSGPKEPLVEVIKIDGLKEILNSKSEDIQVNQFLGYMVRSLY